MIHAHLYLSEPSYEELTKKLNFAVFERYKAINERTMAENERDELRKLKWIKDLHDGDKCL